MLGAGVAWLAAPFATAQQPSKPWRIGYVSNGSVGTAGDQLDAFVLGLREQGWIEGRHFVLESRWAEGKLDRLPALVADLLAQGPDLVYAPSGIAAQATKDSGTSLPIVFAFAPDPIGQGFGVSLARPGRNMTGLTSTHTELSAKRIEILREAFPGIARLGVLYFRALAAAQVLQQVDETERAAKVFGISVFAEESPGPDDFERAFASIRRQKADGLIVVENPMFYTNRVRLCELAATLRIPAMYNVSEWARAGGLMSYGASYLDLSRRAAAYAVKILNGAPPGELPIERPTKLELVVNAKTARAMGLAIPPALLLRAAEVIQ
jgi:putative ABC transport system substrate-binding protein